jgi:hypothetical protein
MACFGQYRIGGCWSFVSVSGPISVCQNTLPGPGFGILIDLSLAFEGTAAMGMAICSRPAKLGAQHAEHTRTAAEIRTATNTVARVPGLR